MAMGFLLRRRARIRTKLTVGISPIPPSHRDYLRCHHAIEGWIEHAAAHVIAYLIASQTANGISGNMMEIGVHHGRLFILLALGRQSGETSLAVDMFEQKHLNSSRFGAGRPRALDRQSGTIRAECAVHPDYREFGHARAQLYPSTLCVDRWRAQSVHHL